MKEVVLKFKLDGVDNSLKSIIDIQKNIEKIKASLASGLSTEGFQKSVTALEELEAEYAKLTGTIQESNDVIAQSNEQMASSTESSTSNAGDSIDKLGKKQGQLADDTKSSSDKIKIAVTAQSEHTAKSFKSAGNNIEKFAKGIVDAVTGVAIIMGSTEEDTKKLVAGFAKAVGIATAVKGSIEGLTSGFELLKLTFPGLVSGLQKIWAVMVANPITAIIAGIAALGVAIYALINAFSDLSDESQEAKNKADALTEAYESQEEQLKKSKAETYALLDAQAQYNQKAIDAVNSTNDLIKAKNKLIDVYEKYGESAIVAKLTEEELREGADKSASAFNEYGKVLLDYISTQDKLSDVAQQEINDTKKKLAATEILIQKNKELKSIIIGGPSIAGVTGQDREGNKLIEQKLELTKELKKQEKDLAVASKNLSDGKQELSERYTNEAVNINKNVTAIYLELKARGALTQAEIAAGHILSKEDEKKIAASEKAAEDAKKKREEDYKNYQDSIVKKYAVLVKYGDLGILKTKEGTAERAIAEETAYQNQLSYIEKYKGLLGMQQVDIDLFKQKYINDVADREKKKNDIIKAADDKAKSDMEQNIMDLTASKIKADDNYITLLKEKKANAIADDKVNSGDILEINKQIYSAELKALQDKYDAERVALNKLLAEKKISQDNYNKEVLTADEKLIEDRKKLNAELAADTKKTTAETEKDILNSINEISGIVNSFSTSIMGIYAAIEEGRQIDRENTFNALNASLEAQAAANQAYYDNALTQLETYSQAELQQTGLTDQEKINIKNNTERQKVALANAAAKADYDLKVQQYNAEEALKEKSFEQDKKMKKAQIIISTITGSIAAFTGMAQAIPGPYGLIAGGLAAALVTAMGAVSYSNVEKQKYQKGTPPTAPKIQVPNLSPNVEPSSKTTTAPSLKDTTLYGTGGTGTGNNKLATSSAPVNVVVNDGLPIKAYVVSGEITDAQQAESALKRKVTGF